MCAIYEDYQYKVTQFVTCNVCITKKTQNIIYVFFKITKYKSKWLPFIYPVYNLVNLCHENPSISEPLDFLCVCPIYIFFTFVTQYALLGRTP